MKKFMEVIVRTTTKERAFITFNEDMTIEEYETRDLNTRESIEILEVLHEAYIEDQLKGEK